MRLLSVVVLLSVPCTHVATHGVDHPVIALYIGQFLPLCLQHTTPFVFSDYFKVWIDRLQSLVLRIVCPDSEDTEQRKVPNVWFLITTLLETERPNGPHHSQGKRGHLWNNTSRKSWQKRR
ncbi:hypothetical protein TRVL_00212 [Trypanosoma vivax]|nr:hypothetical protein TRVL_00212 [Trypanosoma vivax]